ncbi:MAG: DUF4062 domain-containing protein [Treponema sp.]|jgi:hypothetical protein|nr:DUF4062 domain-containing protein [Treponema sp.]
MPKKYFIYLGATLDDLKNESRELFRIILELGHVPVQAPYGEAENGESDRAMAGKVISECDYFISLVAHKYSDGGEPGPLEAEYNQALNCGVPVIALIVDDEVRWRANKKETGAAQIRKLEDFKNSLRRHPHASWSNTQELCQKAQSLLLREINLHPRAGWIPGTQAVDPAVANELARLGVENGELRRRLGIESGDLLGRLREQLKHAVKVLALNRVILSFYYENGKTWENIRKFRYLRIFKALAPELYTGKSTADISRFLGGVLNPDLKRTVRKDFPTPSNTVKKIMADLILLKLVRCAGGSRVDGADSEIWEITEYGKELYAVYRMRQLVRPIEKLAQAATAEKAESEAEPAAKAAIEATADAAADAGGKQAIKKVPPEEKPGEKKKRGRKKKNP